MIIKTFLRLLLGGRNLYTSTWIPIVLQAVVGGRLVLSRTSVGALLVLGSWLFVCLFFGVVDWDGLASYTGCESERSESQYFGPFAESRVSWPFYDLLGATHCLYLLILQLIWAWLMRKASRILGQDAQQDSLVYDSGSGCCEVCLKLPGPQCCWSAGDVESVSYLKTSNAAPPSSRLSHKSITKRFNLNHAISE